MSKLESTAEGERLPNSYSHFPNLVPPYVLDTVSKAHFKEELVNCNVNVSNNNQNQQQQQKQQHHHHHHARANLHNEYKIDVEDEYASFANDLYIRNLNNSWKNFVASVKQPNLFSNQNYDKTVNESYDLNGSWQGDHKLKMALLGSDEELHYQLEKSWFGGSSGTTFSTDNSKSLNNDLEKSKFRSTAGYWMTEQKRAEVIPTLKRILIHNPLVPIFFRILIIMFSGCALGMACTIFQYSHREYNGTNVDQQPSSIMAMVVNTCAIIYLIYIAYDEYNGKPIGLRNPLEKMNYILLDTIFIIFSSANLSLAFNTLFDDRWVCRPSDLRYETASKNYPVVHSICRRQRALASFLFIVIVLWIITFTITVARVIDRVTTKDK